MIQLYSAFLAIKLRKIFLSIALFYNVLLFYNYSIDINMTMHYNTSSTTYNGN